ncbi:IS110 family transposase [Kribbella sp. NPDC026596]|uniref:IS110 family transposase n=1 Tax=Kribbella sp. NPDC026596 TaxID=3155122 RepID=UPI0033F44A36
MEVIRARCAGLDVSKKDAKVCVRVAGVGRRKAVETVTTWSSMTSQILALREHLAAEQVTCVVMEATGDYWKPFYYLLEDLPGVEVVLVNARHVKNLPGRKTDVADATWLAQLGAHGLVRGSFVPPEPIRQLRDLTRTRTAITRERSREIQRLEKLLEDAGIKLSSVATDIVGVSGRAMIEALIAGDRDAGRMADLAQRRMRVKIPQLTEALVGRFNEHHAFLTRVHLDLIDQHTVVISQLTERIEAMMEPFRGFHDLICTIPGISTLTADVVVAETGADMSRFPTAKDLASWAGTTPGNNESAGRVKSSRTRPGNPYLQGALGASAMSIARTPGTYLNAKYRRIATRRGPQKANVAIQHSILVAIWHMGVTGTIYDDPGADYYTRLRPERARQRAIHQLEAMGYRVTLNEAS